jgi:transposase
METPYQWFVGIDWATQQHEVAILDPMRHVHDTFQVPHTTDGIAALLARLRSYGDPATVAIGIELVRGQLIEALVERAYPVYAINPKQSDRFRDRHSVAGAKDDRLDAFVLADSLRTDRPCFHRVQPDEAAVLLLREWSRMEDELREEQSRLTNRLREQLYRYCPQWLTLCPAADEPWFWALLHVAPTPEAARRLRRPRVAACLQAHRIRRLSADSVVEVLRAPPIVVTPGTIAAASAHVALLLPRLELVAAQRKTCIATLTAQLDALATPDDGPEGGPPTDVTIVRSLPGVGQKTVAALLAEASQALAARDLAALRAHAGIAPVTRRSGTRRVVHMRHACSARLRTALYHAARVSAQCDARSREVYAALRARGHSHGRACRSVADRMLRILMAMLRAGTTYQPAHQRVRPATEAPCAA